MPDWVDSDSFIVASRGPYRFSMMPVFWSFIEEQARHQRLASSELVLLELQDGEDQLKQWASGLQSVMFRVPTEEVQERYREVVANVNGNGRYAQHHVSRFLAKADPWLIAHARTDGGRIVTFEKPEPTSRKPKIPDVSHEFGISCINLFDLIEELGFSV